MSRWKIQLGFAAALYALPFVALSIAGCLWLYEHRMATWFAALTAIALLLGWFIFRAIHAKMRKTIHVPTNTLGVQGEDAARRAIERIAKRAEEDSQTLDDAQKWQQLARELFDSVAVCFHGTSEKPSLEITVPDAMFIAERVLHDLRVAAKDNIPGAHILTIRQYEKMFRALKTTQAVTANDSPWRIGYRVLRLIWNPSVGVFKEVQDKVLGNVGVRAMADGQRWLVGYSVRRAGEYAIQLYSGQLALIDPDFKGYRSSSNMAEQGRATEIDTRRADEPLRIIILGQTKAGKSSLINALFGEYRAATDTLPCTSGITPYVLEREGIPRAILFDTEGFGGVDDRRAIESFESEIVKCDLVIMVCAVTSASRDADRKLLNAFRELITKRMKRSMPPVVVALTHVDRLRPFQEWSPPYDLRDTTSPKARNMADAVAQLHEDLEVPAQVIVPVCLRSDGVYNVNESLIPTLLEQLPVAEQAKLIRLLREFHASEYWKQLSRQAFNSGRVLVKLIGRASAGLRKP